VSLNGYVHSDNNPERRELISQEKSDANFDSKTYRIQKKE
jgi:hypothetical protein